MPWWVWMVVGLLLLGAEALTPGGFYFLFFGISGLVVGLLSALGLVEELWLQGLLFSGLAILALALFRHRLLRLMGGAEAKVQPVDAIVGELALPLEDLSVDAAGKAELRGTTWNARNADSKGLKSGQRCKVERVEGLTLFLKAE